MINERELVEERRELIEERIEEKKQKIKEDIETKESLCAGTWSCR